MNKFKIILGYLVGFVSTILLVILVLLLITKTSLLSKNYVVNTLKDNDYYERINKEIREEMEIHLLSTGFTNEILDNIYTKEEVIEDINLFIDNAYQGKKTTLDKSEMRFKIKINIDNYVKKTSLSVMNKNELEKFVNDIVDIYKKEICLYGYTDSVIPKIPKISRLVDTTIIRLIVSLCILVFILIKFTKARFISSITIATGLIILFIRLFIFEKIDSDNILIITEDFSKILRIVMNNLKSNLLLIPIGLITIGLLILIIEVMCKPQKKN